jgi:hypothetical protein
MDTTHYQSLYLETPKTIATWSQKTFGPSTLLNIGVRGMLEVAEMVLAFRELFNCLGPSDVPVNEPTRKLVRAAQEEVVDVWIMLSQIAYRSNVPLPEAFEASGTQRLRTMELPLEMAAIYAKLLMDLNVHAVPLPSLIILQHLGLQKLFFQLHRLLLPPGSALHSLDFNRVITEKMKVNRARRWEKSPAGYTRHVSDTPMSTPSASVTPRSFFVEEGTGMTMDRSLWYIISDSGSAYCPNGFASRGEALEYVHSEEFQTGYGPTYVSDVSLVSWNAEARDWLIAPIAAINIVLAEDLWAFWQANPLDDSAPTAPTVLGRNYQNGGNEFEINNS